MFLTLIYNKVQKPSIKRATAGFFPENFITSKQIESTLSFYRLSFDSRLNFCHVFFKIDAVLESPYIVYLYVHTRPHNLPKIQLMFKRARC